MSINACIAETRSVSPSSDLQQAPIARNKEVLVAVTNSALINADGTFGMLRTWLDAVQNAGVVNYVVVCLDDRVRQSLTLLTQEASMHSLSLIATSICRIFYALVCPPEVLGQNLECGFLHGIGK